MDGVVGMGDRPDGGVGMGVVDMGADSFLNNANPSSRSSASSNNTFHKKYVGYWKGIEQGSRRFSKTNTWGTQEDDEYRYTI